MSQTASPIPATVSAEVRALRAVLEQEHDHYVRLLAVARRQGELLSGRDLDGLDSCSRELAAGLEEATAARLRREDLAQRVMDSSGPARHSLSLWLAGQPDPVQAELAGAVQDVRRAAGELERANEHNRRLASFCLDLVEEEAALLRRSLLEDPAGRYDSGARPTTNAQGSVLRRQA